MITKSMVIEAQTTWGKGVVQIGTLKNSPKECVVFTKQFVEQLYAFDYSTVLFKPTKCAVQQFRPSAAEAISYFIAGEQRACQEDKGFALQPWTHVRFENSDLILEDTRAIAMGNYYFTDLDGQEAKVEYTFGYTMVEGQLKIDVHHSSFPFQNS